MNDLPAIMVLLPAGTTGDVHSTLTYFGTPEQAMPLETCAVLARTLARMVPKPLGFVTKHDVFGDDDPVRVAVLDGVDLYALHKAVESYANSKWGYAPHISAQPGYELPAVGTPILFDRIGVWYGEQRLTYRFGTGSPAAP